jgi:translocator protein
MQRSFIWPVLATAGLIAVLMVNTLANTLPINGLTTGDVSRLYPSVFTPAGITFSIWSVIYFLLVGFVIQMWVQRTEAYIRSVVPLFVLSCILNVTWILSWHYLMPLLSVIVMAGLLATLALLFLRIHGEVPGKRVNRLLVMLPFTMYFAWICVATIANVSALLVSVGWDGSPLSQEIWTVIMTLVAAGLGMYMLFTYDVPAFTSVIGWAMIGIFLRWKESDYLAVKYASISLAALMVAVTFLSLRARKRMT